MTETNMILSNPYEGERRPGHVGLPLPGVEVRAVADEPAGEGAGSPPSWPWRLPGAPASPSVGSAALRFNQTMSELLLQPLRAWLPMQWSM